MRCGSSPLTRGKLPQAQRAQRSDRLIPAHAGKTPRYSAVIIGPPAHPRSRGENALHCWLPPRRTGSSPLTRGKHQGGGLGCRRLGLIPAHAGKTERDPYSDETLSGSSPLTRGKPPRSPSRVRVMGLIPAHAGKTLVADDMHFSVPAHPRSRGENENPPLDSANPHGSSPLTRGKPGDHAAPGFRRRLIPAHAGKTPFRGRTRRPWPAHPRSRGENLCSGSVVVLVPGSSPLTRGKHLVTRSVLVSSGLIPAHAGKTGALPLALTRRSAHPRSRGENPCG